MKAIPEGFEGARALDKRAGPAVQDGKILKLSVMLTEQHAQPTEEHPGKLSIPLPLVTHEPRDTGTPDEAYMTAHAVHGLADMLDEQRRRRRRRGE